MSHIDLIVFQAVQDDAVRIYSPGLKTQMGKANPTARFKKISPSTVFGQSYTLFAVDEAHVACKHNLAHMAFRALRDKVKMLVAMTATPVTT